jgi:hypothetical protein
VQKSLYLTLAFAGCLLSGYLVDLVHFIGWAPTEASIQAAVNRGVAWA